MCVHPSIIIDFRYGPFCNSIGDAMTDDKDKGYDKVFPRDKSTIQVQKAQAPAENVFSGNSFMKADGHDSKDSKKEAERRRRRPS